MPFYTVSSDDWMPKSHPVKFAGLAVRSIVADIEKTSSRSFYYLLDVVKF